MLLVAFGYSITKPELGKKNLALFLSLTIGYGLAAAAGEYVIVIRSMGVNVGVIPDMVFVLLTTFLNAFFAVYIAMELARNMKLLHDKKQTEKYSLYRKLAWFLGIFIALSVLLYAADLCALVRICFCLFMFSPHLFSTLTVGNYRDTYWQWWWIFDAFWEVAYFVEILIIGFLWRPNECDCPYQCDCYPSSLRVALQEQSALCLLDAARPGRRRRRHDRH